MDQNQQKYAQIAKQNLLDQQLVMKLNEKSISMPLSLTSNTQNNSSPINLIKPMTSQNLNQYHRQSDKFDNSYLLQDQIMKTNNKTVNNNQTFDQQKPQQSDTKYNTVLKGFQTENQRYESRIKELQQRLRNGDKFSSSVNHTRDNSFSKDQTAVQKNLQSKQVDVQVIQKSKNQTLNLIKPGQLQEQVMKKQSQGTHQRNNSYQLGSNINYDTKQQIQNNTKKQLEKLNTMNYMSGNKQIRTNQTQNQAKPDISTVIPKPQTKQTTANQQIPPQSRHYAQNQNTSVQNNQRYLTSNPMSNDNVIGNKQQTSFIQQKPKQYHHARNNSSFI
eukprot:403358209